jgi:adenylate cyclase
MLGRMASKAATERPEPRNEEFWRGILLGTDPRFKDVRRWLKHLPSAPRCKFCAAPFKGAFVPLMKAQGRAPWHRNPNYCAFCFKVIEDEFGGAEIECSLLFADVRGSTALAEQMSSMAFRKLMDRFFRTATDILVEKDGIIDKYVGDEVVAIFIPALVEGHAARALAAARAMLVATGHDDPDGPWLPVGAGIATGVAYVGAVGSGRHTEFTALGDIVNTAARLASVAGAGEILLTMPSVEGADLDASGLEHRTLDLKGKSLQVEVAVVRGAP